MAEEDDRDQVGRWLNLTEAAHRLGWSRERLRSQARRGRLQTMRGNAGELLVLVTSDLTGAATVGRARPERSPTRSVAAGQADREEVERLRAELAKVTAELLDARERAARAEERLAGRDALVEELRRQLDRDRQP